MAGFPSPPLRRAPAQARRAAGAPRARRGRGLSPPPRSTAGARGPRTRAGWGLAAADAAAAALSSPPARGRGQDGACRHGWRRRQRRRQQQEQGRSAKAGAREPRARAPDQAKPHAGPGEYVKACAGIPQAHFAGLQRSGAAASLGKACQGAAFAPEIAPPPPRKAHFRGTRKRAVRCPCARRAASGLLHRPQGCRAADRSRGGGGGAVQVLASPDLESRSRLAPDSTSRRGAAPRCRAARTAGQWQSGVRRRCGRLQGQRGGQGAARTPSEGAACARPAVPQEEGGAGNAHPTMRPASADPAAQGAPTGLRTGAVMHRRL